MAEEKKMFLKSFKHLLQDEVSCSLEIPISLCLLFKKEKKKKEKQDG